MRQPSRAELAGYVVGVALAGLVACSSPPPDPNAPPRAPETAEPAPPPSEVTHKDVITYDGRTMLTGCWHGYRILKFSDDVEMIPLAPGCPT